MKTISAGSGLLAFAVIMFGNGADAATSSLTGTRSVMDTGWHIQTATSPDIPPDADKWEQIKDGTWPTQKYRKGHPHNLWYRHVFSAPAKWEGGRVLLDFHRIEGDAVIFINDQRVGELLRPGGECELTENINFGADNKLTVFVTRNYTGISRGFEDDPLRYYTRGPKSPRPVPVAHWALGITAPVELLWRPTPAAIAGILVRTSWRDKEIAVDADIETTKPLSGVCLEIRVADEAGKEVLVATGEEFDLPSGSSVQTVRSDWLDPIPWELEAPYLYTVSTRLLADDETLDKSAKQRFGFREIWTEGRHVYLNGHVSRWTIETFLGATKNQLSLLRLLGRNVLLLQNNPTSWWSSWSEIPYYGSGPDLCDEEGFGLLMPALNVSHVRDIILRDDRARADYEREMRLWVRRYRNHPSILAWCVSMNDLGDRGAIHPATIGQRVDYGGNLQAQVVEKAMATVRANDPTRLVFSHAGGNYTDIAAANVYPNWAPFQEVADWAERWAERGDMPWFPAEWGLCTDQDWFRGKRFFGTEFAAIYFGDQAYTGETEKLLADTMKISLAGTGSLGLGKVARDNFPMYWKVHDLFATYCDRALRTWGVLGWQHWNFATGYGDPPAFDSPHPFGRYRSMTEPVTEKPEWANPFFDIYSRHMQPLLAYIGGSPTHTDRTHAYFTAETVEKQAVIVWDGPGDRSFDLQWRLMDGDSEKTRGNKHDISMAAGDVLLLPISFTAPDVDDRSEFIVEMQLSENGEPVAEDSFAIHVFPETSPPRLSAKAAIWDPEGKTRKWTRNLFTSPPTDVVPGDTLEGYDLLLIGREALGPGAELPWKPGDIRRGLKVIVFAQKPRLWEGFGF
ncbi:MAG: hypothetical protein K9M45_14135, partial [Kiritimatiellales bacterium]|nr:hypothetical protein [Kiritimatiellales bacterium]